MLEEEIVGGKKMLEAKNLKRKKSALPLTSPPRKFQGWDEGVFLFFLSAGKIEKLKCQKKGKKIDFQ